MPLLLLFVDDDTDCHANDRVGYGLDPMIVVIMPSVSTIAASSMQITLLLQVWGRICLASTHQAIQIAVSPAMTRMYIHPLYLQKYKYVCTTDDTGTQL